MCRSGSIAKSQMLTEIKKDVAIAKVRILVESGTVKHLQTLTAFSSEMPISLHDNILVVCRCVFKKNIIYTFMSLTPFFKSLCPRYVGQLFWLMNSGNGLWTVYIMLIEKRQISWRSCFNILTQRYVTEESEEI